MHNANKPEVMIKSTVWASFVSWAVRALWASRFHSLDSGSGSLPCGLQP